MGATINYAIFCVLVLLFPALFSCIEDPIFQSKATYFHAPEGLGTPRGGCGYGEYGRTVNEGDVAVVTSSKLYKSGASCDYGVSDGETDFILSTHAYNKLAMPGLEKELKDYGRVHIEYQRVGCKYPGKTLTLKVMEHSHYHSYLALQFLYKAGDADITAVELFQEDTLEWKTCRRAYGAVWDMGNPPKGPLTVRFFLDRSANVRAQWVLVPKVIPLYWHPGLAYDTSIQLH
ncbi:Expansin-like B1 [Bienertia sinuspersici]